MLRLFTIVLFSLFTSLTLAQNRSTFRAGTITYNHKDALPSTGTFTVFYGDLALLTVTMPNGEPLFDVSSPLSKGNFWGSSPKSPLSGTYQARLEDKTIL